MTETGDLAEIRTLLVALLSVAIDEREDRVADDSFATKSEVILDSAGLTSQSIAEIVRKKPDAVRKTLSRSKNRRL